MDTDIRVSTESQPWRRKFSRRSCRDLNPGTFSHKSSALTTELSPSPMQRKGLTMKDQHSQSLQMLVCCEILSECTWPCQCLYVVKSSLSAHGLVSACML